MSAPPLARVMHEQDKYGLELKESVNADGFDKIMKRLIQEPPAPKQKRRKRGITKSQRRRK
jgi:hypothetical protein